ncbi:multicopper oxidase family protein [Acidicapsa ligni]|uniref:multicopper oxidase family protein n=1 Tax=Acidicapsa ligni TaxID=542300 RepID=UPI0021E0C9BA|nr:multicopper oxidase domain-containing protein [Acidicapsa ligni]
MAEMMSHRAAPHRAVLSVPNLDPNSLERYVDALPVPEIAKASGMHEVPGQPGVKVPFYRQSMREISTKLHRDLPATRMWSYGGSVPGVTFETRSGQGLLVEWTNALPAKHFLPIDHSLHGAEKGSPEVRGVVHLHGGKTPPEHDGYPEDWYVPGKSRSYYYPNEQDATLLWYHDHSMGINRLNIYAGMLGLHVIRDEVEDALHLPSGKYEVPLVIMDRDLHEDGQLSYPVSADPDKPWVPEAFGAAQLVNGKLFPYLDVEARKYRFRVLNGANGRFYRLSLSEGVEMHQIGSDQGLLAGPVAMKHVQLAPGERVDLVVDFAGHRGAKILLASDSFPLMQFRVGADEVHDASELPKTLRPVARIAENSSVMTRRLTLDETESMVGESMGMLLNKTPWHMPITEKPVLGSTEIWEFVNLTDDTHPIHLHMVKFQVLDRRPFEAFEYMTAGTLRYTGAVMAPDANEMGWKDTVRVNAKTVTRIIVPFVGYPGRYVWHCHLLEHEDNEMMRPYEVVKA